MDIKIYTDGMSKGNPGNSFAGAIILIENQIMRLGKYLGIQTNNYAELQGVNLALNQLIVNFPEKYETFEIKIYSDSDYVVKIFNGEYTARKHRNLIRKIWKLTKSFKKVEFFYQNKKNFDSYIPDVEDFLSTVPMDGKVKVDFKII